MSDKGFRCGRVAQEALWARGCAVRAGLKNDDQIAWLRDREIHPVTKEIERRAQGPNGGGDSRRCPCTLLPMTTG